MIGIVSVTSDTRAVRVALLSHHWAEFQTVRTTQDWAGLHGFGYHYAPADRAFLKECAGPAAVAPPVPAVDRAARHAVCQEELDHVAAVTEVGMYTQLVNQLARRGIHWHGRCLTEGEVVSALGEPT